MFGMLRIVIAGVLALSTAAPALCKEGMFEIRVVDRATGRGVPMIELRTTNQIRFMTDSAGYVAITDEDLLNQPVFFMVSGHGYQYPVDPLNQRGMEIRCVPGKSHTFVVDRLLPAERIYRLTGTGIYNYSRMLGKPDPLRDSISPGNVVGCDGILGTVHRGKAFWIWGDTARREHVLGNYQATLAFSELPGKGGLDPEVGVDYTYVMDDKPSPNTFVKSVAQMPGDGTTWLTSLMTVFEKDGTENLYAYYNKFRYEFGEYKSGLAVYDDEKREFAPVKDFNKIPQNLPHGTAVRRRLDGVDWLYFCEPMAQVRVRADLDGMVDPANFESFTGLVAGATLRDQKVERSPTGDVVYGWKKNSPANSPPDDKWLVARGDYRREESWYQFRDRDTGKEAILQHGTVNWNPYRKRWVAILSEINGQDMSAPQPFYTGPPQRPQYFRPAGSFLGETWYTEADTPVGPWIYGVKVATHNNYSFYNPRHHPFFDKEGGRVIFFEGSYVTIHSTAFEKTERYDYNQLMYRLDLADPRVAIPAAVYETAGVNGSQFATGPKLGDRKVTRVPFLAHDSAVGGAIPVYEMFSSTDGYRLSLQKPADGNSEPVFYALSAETPNAPVTARPLYEFVNARAHQRRYSTTVDQFGEGFERMPKPLCLVWENPMKISWSPDLTPPTE